MNEAMSLPEGLVGIDCRSLKQGPAGIATCVENLLRHLPQLECLADERPGNNFLWNHWRAFRAQRKRGWKVYHAPSYTAPLLNSAKLVLMVADVSYLIGGDIYPYRSDPLRNWYYRASLRRADRILVPTDFTGSELTRLFPETGPRIRRVYLGVSDAFAHHPGLAGIVRAKYRLPERFVLHVGDIHPRRNIGLLEEAARRLGLPLVLIGKILRGGEGLAEHPLRFSGLTTDELKGFYSAATLFGYPSSYEGFGLPLLEAMACRLPVAASNRSCIPEVCGDAAVLVDPEVESLVEGLREALGRSEELIVKGVQRARCFSWANTARETLRVYRELLE